MKYLLGILTVLSLLAACGQEKHHAVYDTDANPDNFPPAAVEVIRQIESGSLVGAEAVTGAIGDLLTEHGDLLDRPEWRQAVGRMGGLFRNVGDSLTRQGIASYGLAAEYYQLAALGRPDDSVIRSLAGMFNCWKAAEGDSIDGIPVAAAIGGDLNQLLAVCRRFMFSDTLCQWFLTAFLRPAIFQSGADNGLKDPQALAQLASADRALLASAGMIDASGLDTRTSFASPQVDLIAARITRLDSLTCRAEIYLCPREPIPNPLKVHLRLNSDDGGAWPIELVPPKVATAWTPGQVVLVTRVFPYSATLATAAVGLTDFALPRPNFLRPDKSRSDLFLLDRSDLVVN